MKSKYSIGFLSCCACLIIAMTFAYQFSYQKAKARAEKLKIEEQQTMENEDSSSVTTGSKASKNDCYYLMEVNGYIVVYFSDKKTPYEYTDIHYDELPELLRRLSSIPGIQWIRLQYCYPEEITDELIETIKNEEKVCRYLDIPIQHASDAILKRMGRRTSNKEIRELVAKLRREIPDIALRTTFISGFPGETEEDHEILMEFVDDMEFDRLGVFAYSPEEDTPAYSFKDQVPDEVKEDRRAEIMELQQDIAFEKSESMKGSVLEVMIEGKVADENAYVGRTYMDSPGVDGLIFVNTGLSLMSGDFVRVRVTGALEYDLIGEVEDEFTE